MKAAKEESNANYDSLITLEIVTPETSFSFEGIYMVVMPGSEGEFGVSRGHVALIASLDPGNISIYDSNMKITNHITISTGFAEVTDKSVLVLAEQAFQAN